MAWHEPLSKEGGAARRAQTTGNTHICIQQSQAQGTSEVQSPCRCGVAQVFLADSSSALHRAGPGGCKFSMRLRLGGFRICLRQLCKRCLSIPEPLFHLAGLLLQLWFGREVVCSAPGRAGWHSVNSPARVFSLTQQLRGSLLLYPISKASCPPEERPDPADGLQSPWPPSALTCTSKKDEVHMAPLVPEITAGHPLACWLPPCWKSFHLGFPSHGCFVVLAACV